MKCIKDLRLSSSFNSEKRDMHTFVGTEMVAQIEEITLLYTRCKTCRFLDEVLDGTIQKDVHLLCKNTENI